MSVNSEIKGKRVFNWRSKSCHSPVDADDHLEFGLIDPKTNNWLFRISVRWTLEQGQVQAMVKNPLADWCQSPLFLDVAARLGDITQWPSELPAFRLAIILSSLGFYDITEYFPSITENVLRQELHEAEEHVERLKDRLAGGYYPH